MVNMKPLETEKMSETAEHEAAMRQQAPHERVISCRDMVKKYLEQNGFDGLCGEECGCDLRNLIPCSGGEWVWNCVAGHIVAGCDCGEGHDFHIVPGKGS